MTCVSLRSRDFDYFRALMMSYFNQLSQALYNVSRWPVCTVLKVSVQIGLYSNELLTELNLQSL